MSESVRRFSEVETAELGEYKPLSRLAVVGVVVAFVGIIAAFQPWLVAIPALAAVMSAIAVATSARSDSQAGGRWLASCGLLLALFLVGFASARSYSRKQHLRDLARPHAESWLRLILEGRVKEAHQLTLKESERDKGDLDKAYSIGQTESMMAMTTLHEPHEDGADSDAMAEAPRPRRDELEVFVAMPYVAKLLDHTPEAAINFVSDELILDTTSRTTIAETFSVVEPGHEELEVTMVLQRTAYGGHASWHVSTQ